ncbi:ABC transporter [Tsuneonella sp. HG249]
MAIWATPGLQKEDQRPALGLFTSLPIFWAESASVAEALDSTSDLHWVRILLEEENRLVPVDTLDGDALVGLKRLIMAQPRPLAPSENVALDDWVNGGGRLLLFADPLLTEESRFALGDRRRPQDMAVLSPILARWGLELQFDESQPDAERRVPFRSVTIPVRLAGSLKRMKTNAQAKCVFESESLVARCRIGEGAVLVVADASVLESARSVERPEEALRTMNKAAFAD